MTISFHTTATQTFLTMLKGLQQVLKVAEADAQARKIDPQVLLNSRLAPDMFSLVRQVQIATDNAKGAVHRLAGREIPKFEDSETSFAELQTRLERTIELIKSIPAQEIDGHESRTITMSRPSGEMVFTAPDYLLGFAIPNFMFHVVTAYNILRHNGVPLGKDEFFGRERSAA
jgi:uncharacterized protein